MKKVYKKNILKGLHDLSSYEFQKIAWFANNQGLSSDFSDDVSAVFESSGIEDILYSNEVIFGKEADKALRELDELVEAIGYDRLDSELIDTPEMQEIREKAARALELIKASHGFESTVEIIE